MEHVWGAAAIWMALALVASLFSIRLGVSVALVEIAVGVFGGNVLHLEVSEWINVLAGIGAVVLTFLAGAEIDPESLRRHLKPSLAIGIAGFLFPFLGAAAFARFVAGWASDSSWIAGIALSTTSVAVVYAVMVETGLNQTELGKLILAACFINDLGTVLALGLIFAGFDRWLVAFVAVSALVLWPLPRLMRWVIQTWGGRVSEPEVKFLLLVLFALGWLATRAGSEAVLPAYLIGLVVAGVFQESRALMLRLRTIAFGALTPFYFIKAGLFVSIPAIISGAALIGAFLLVKMAAKVAGVWPLTRIFAMERRSGTYTTLLMSTGLTFGTISALFGLTNGIIDQSQYTVLVTAVIGSAVVPTLIAQTWFLPETAPDGAREPGRASVHTLPAMESSSLSEGED
ncbi:Na(+)/H(+)-K(+) antiporter GerN [bacterium HR26]|nr:Na(+)/H(+)-K(+) antiporter GerN [bacterium HR26]